MQGGRSTPEAECEEPDSTFPSEYKTTVFCTITPDDVPMIGGHF